eukprot:4773262-Prymnesium_polylepis.1
MEAAHNGCPQWRQAGSAQWRIYWPCDHGRGWVIGEGERQHYHCAVDERLGRALGRWTSSDGMRDALATPGAATELFRDRWSVIAGGAAPAPVLLKSRRLRGVASRTVVGIEKVARPPHTRAHLGHDCSGRSERGENIGGRAEGGHRLVCAPRGAGSTRRLRGRGVRSVSPERARARAAAPPPWPSLALVPRRAPLTPVLTGVVMTV